MAQTQEPQVPGAAAVVGLARRVPGHPRGDRRLAEQRGRVLPGPGFPLCRAVVSSVMSYLIITGSFACGMAFHNTTARYMYSLGREGLAPKVLGHTHPKWKSPHIASITQSVIAAIIIALFAIFTGSNDLNHQAYLQLYGLMAVMGVIIIPSVQALISLAILIYHERYHRDEVHWWKTRLAPLISFFSHAYVVYLLFTNISFLGGGYGYANWLGPIDAVVVIAGVAAAFCFKRGLPAKYEQAGRLINEGL